MAYRYVHALDGRRGEGWSVWAAVCAAIGPAEAKAMPEMAELQWNYGHGYSWAVRIAPLVSEGDNPVDFGTVYELR